MSLHQLLAVEWKRERDIRLRSARLCSEPLMCRSMIWAARKANYELIKLRRAA